MRYALVLVLILGLANAGNVYIEKPWESYNWLANNPHIFYYAGHDVWFDISSQNITMHQTIDSLDLSKINVSADDNTIKKKLRQVIIEKNNAQDKYSQCTALISETKKKMERRCIFDKYCTAHVIMNAWILFPSCLEYDGYWKVTMTESANILEYSIKSMYNSKKKLNKSFDEIVRMGLCDKDYYDSGKKECVEVYAALETINSKSIEGNNGKYNLALLKKNEIADELTTYMPKMENYSSIINFIWSKKGIMTNFDELEKKVDKSKKSSISRYQELKLNSTIQKKKVENKEKQLRKENLEKITKAVTRDTVVGGNFAGSISNRYELLNKKMKNASTHFELGKKYGKTNNIRGHYKNAINEMKQSVQMYSSLDLELDILEEDAKKVVLSKKKQAEKEINGVQNLLETELTNNLARSYLNSAKGLYGNGSKEKKLGNQFEFYIEAEKYAKIAKVNTGNTQYAGKIEQQSRQEKLGTLIKNAEKDGLIFPGDKEEFTELKNQKENWVKQRMENISHNIISRAKNRFGYLEDWRKEIKNRINLADGEVNDQLIEMEKIERGLITNDKIDYTSAIGKLQMLETSYRSIDSIVNISMVNITANSLTKLTNIFIEEVKIDEKTNITLYIRIENKNNYGAKKVPVKLTVPVGFELLYSDITHGKENVSTIFVNKKSEFIIVFNEIRPKSRYTIIFEKEKILAKSTKEKTVSQGLGDGSARIEKKIDFELETDIDRLQIPKHMKNTKVDGKESYGSLEKGKHTLEARYVLGGAYELKKEKLKTYMLGLNSKVEYELVLKPKIDLDKVKVFVNTGFDERINNVKIYSITGEEGGRVLNIAPGYYSTVFKKLDANRTTRIFVSYRIANTTDYIKKRLEDFEKGNYSDSIRSAIGKVKGAVEQNSWSEALNKLKEVDKMIEQKRKNDGKNNKKIKELRGEITDELNQIANVIASAKNKSTNHTFISKLLAREKELIRVINESYGKESTEELNILDKVDRKWLGKELTVFRKEMFKEYNSLAERYVSLGNRTDEFNLFENALHALEVSGNIEYVPDILENIAKIKKFVNSKEEEREIEKKRTKESFLRIKNDIIPTISSYKKQLSAAKGTDIENIFTYNVNAVESDLKNIEKMIDRGSDVTEELRKINKTKNNMNAFLNSLKKESKGKLNTVDALFNKQKEKLQKDISGKIEKRLKTMKNLINSGNYVAAIKAGNSILSELQSAKTDNSHAIWLFGLTATGILIVVLAYFFKQRIIMRKNGTKPIKLKRAE